MSKQIQEVKVTYVYDNADEQEIVARGLDLIMTGHFNPRMTLKTEFPNADETKINKCFRMVLEIKKDLEDESKEMIKTAISNRAKMYLVKFEEQEDYKGALKCLEFLMKLYGLQEITVKQESQVYKVNYRNYQTEEDDDE